MGLILWIDKNDFAASLISKVFKKRDLEFYHLSHADDFAYLVEDLRPILIVLDEKTASDSLEALRRQYESSAQLQQSRFVVIGSWEGLDFIQNRAGALERKIDPFSVPEKLQKLML